VTRSRLHRLVRRGLRSGRWSPGPYSYLARLQAAAYGGHRCHPVVDDQGRMVASYLGGDLDERGRAAMLALVAAARQHHQSTTPEQEPDRG
jgi:hypothetical protein